MLNALNVNVNVSRARRDHEMAPSSCASSRMEAISADPTDTLGDPNERPMQSPRGKDASKSHQQHGCSCQVGTQCQSAMGGYAA